VGHLKKKAVEDGLLTLRSDGLGKLQNGTTTAEEVLKDTAPVRYVGHGGTWVSLRQVLDEMI
jgi:hypothetical protein